MRVIFELYRLFDNCDLIKALVKREILGRYRGSFFGIFWSFVNPLLTLLLYTFVFGTVFQARWPNGSGSTAEFAMILFSGLIVFNLFVECFTRAPSLVISNANYVKKVVFPLDILPVVVLGSALFHALISLLAWLLVYIVLFGLPSPQIVFVPVVITPFLFFILGVSWFLASLGVYIRDLTQFTSVLATALLFTAPILFPLSMIPENLQFLIMLNPLTPVIEQMRAIMIFGQLPDWGSFALTSITGMATAILGHQWFQRTRKGFADVL